MTPPALKVNKAKSASRHSMKFKPNVLKTAILEHPELEKAREQRKK
jgi:hypothetical protein